MSTCSQLRSFFILFKQKLMVARLTGLIAPGKLGRKKCRAEPKLSLQLASNLGLAGSLQKSPPRKHPKNHLQLSGKGSICKQVCQSCHAKGLQPSGKGSICKQVFQSCHAKAWGDFVSPTSAPASFPSLMYSLPMNFCPC